MNNSKHQPNLNYPTMNPEQVWSIQKAKLQLLFPHLHEEDFHYDYGKKEPMLNLLQQKLGKTREELEALLLEI